MAKLLVGTYESHPDAEDTRRELLDQGFPQSQVNVHAPDTAAAHSGDDAEPKAQRGLAGFIARMRRRRRRRSPDGRAQRPSRR